ncbi:MAG: hypothetical protein KGQ47_15575, partial [Hyphomicrobiales bacterium]|nr:hypothetical protein [Hyphomicrobiales bacterium]
NPILTQRRHPQKIPFYTTSLVPFDAAPAATGTHAITELHSKSRIQPPLQPLVLVKSAQSGFSMPGESGAKSRTG